MRNPFSAARRLAACALLPLGLSALALAAVPAGSRAAGPPCPPGARCGSIAVPLDRAEPAAGTTRVAYALFRHTGPVGKGVVVPNPGGPGESTIGSADLYLGALKPLLTSRDLLLIDMPGTGRSGAIRCPTLERQNPLSVTQADLSTYCGADLGGHARFYATEEAANDIDAVRAHLGFERIDAWGDSYGTFLMTVYAALHPEHVRSVVLDGAFPLHENVWGRDILAGTRRVIDLVCRRTHRCEGPRLLAQIGRLAARLGRRPISFAAHLPDGGPIRLQLNEKVLAQVTFGGGDPSVYATLPAAVTDALHGEYALLRRMVTASRLGEVTSLTVDPHLFSVGAATAYQCHDYPRVYDLAASPATRRAEYATAAAALPPDAFAPFSVEAWMSTGIDAGPKCLNWPATAGAGGLSGLTMPDVPVLVQSGDLDTNTPLEQGRAAAAQFPDATFAVSANAGHTPDLHPCGVRQAIRFVEHLRTDARACVHAGRPPRVIASPPRTAAALAGPGHPSGHRVAAAVARATLEDATAAEAAIGGPGWAEALRGGHYQIGERSVHILDARVVGDAVVDGTARKGPDGTVARLTVRVGRGTPTRVTLRRPSA